MIVGIDGHSLEGNRTGVGRYLSAILNKWLDFELDPAIRFVIYFKQEIPNDFKNRGSRFDSKLLKPPFNFYSTAFFTHWLLPRAAKKDKIDILFCPGYIAPIFYSGKIVLTLHDIIYEARPDLYSWPSAWDKILLKKISKISAKKASLIFAPSKFSRQEIISYYQVKKEKVLAIPLAAEIEKTNDGEEIKRFKKRLGINNRFILFVGSIFNRRHLSEAIAAFKIAARRLPDCQFLIVGRNYTVPFVDIDGVIRKTNEKLSRQAVKHVDYIKEELTAAYSAADLLLWLSDYEGFGLPVLEAMACGTPVVTSQKASLPEVAGEAALYVKNNKEIDKIAEKIIHILTDEEAKQDLINKGIARAHNFSWQKCARKTLDAILSSE